MADLSGLTTNFFPTPKEGFTTTTSGSIDSSTDTTIGLNSVSGLTNGNVFTGLIDPGNAKERAFTGLVDTSGSQITNVVFTTGSNATHTAGATVVDYVTSTHIAQIVKGLLASVFDQDGTMKAGAVDVAGVLASDVVTTAKILDSSVTGEKLGTPVAFYATTTATAANTTTLTNITSYTEVYDSGADFASGVFTAPYAGVYHFDLNLKIDNVTADNRFLAAIEVNDTAVAQSYSVSRNSVHDPTANISITLLLAANDTVNAAAANEAGGSIAFNNSSFGGFLIGRTA